jgi:hypothetical protein
MIVGWAHLQSAQQTISRRYSDRMNRPGEYLSATSLARRLAGPGVLEIQVSWISGVLD